MIGPHYQRLAEAQRHITGKQMLERINSRAENPLTAVIDKLKRQFTQYETAYTEDICNQQISSVDRLLSFDGKLGPILAAIEKENNLLRRELSLLESQLSNSVSICEQVIAQNNELKEALLQKNEDIRKIIQTVAHHESESRNELEDRIAILEQENSILIQHLEEVRKKHDQYRVMFQSKDEEISRWERKWNETKKHLSQAIEREREITRKLAVSEHLLFENKEKLEIMENNYYAAELEKTQLERQVTVLQGNKDSYNPQVLRRTMQNQYMQIIEEHRVLKNERHNMTREVDKAKSEKQGLEQAIVQIQKKFNKVITEYELTNNLLTEQKGKNQSLISTLKKLENKMDEFRNQNVQLRMEVDSAKELMLSKEKSMNSEVLDLRKELDQRATHSTRLLKDIQIKNQQLLDAKDLEIKRLIDENTEYRRLVERRG